MCVYGVCVCMRVYGIVGFSSIMKKQRFYYWMAVFHPIYWNASIFHSRYVWHCVCCMLVYVWHTAVIIAPTTVCVRWWLWLFWWWWCVCVCEFLCVCARVCVSVWSDWHPRVQHDSGRSAGHQIKWSRPETGKRCAGECRVVGGEGSKNIFIQLERVCLCVCDCVCVRVRARARILYCMCVRKSIWANLTRRLNQGVGGWCESVYV